MGAPWDAVTRHTRVAFAVVAAFAVLLIVLFVRGGGGGEQRITLPGSVRLAWSAHPFAYVADRAGEFTARATAGSAGVLFGKSPGGVVATAARVARYRRLIDAAVSGTEIDANLLEGLVFLESAGDPNALAGPDAADAAGLTQILAQTGQSLLGMHVDLARSRTLTAAIDAAYSAGKPRLLARLQGERARIDDRFNPARALAATVRYLKIAQRDLGGRTDLAIVAYHMGIGNLQQILQDYDGGQSVPYVQLYFDTAPDDHPAAYNLLSSLGDDSSLYYWRVLEAVRVMQLYRTDRPALRQLAKLEVDGSTAGVLRVGQRSGPLVALPSDPGRYGLAYGRRIVRRLRPAAVDLLAALGTRVKQLWSGSAPLTVTYTDQGGYSFAIARRYARLAQADAFQAVLDRLQALDLIAWMRTRTSIVITVAGGASQYLINGP